MPKILATSVNNGVETGMKTLVASEASPTWGTIIGNINNQTDLRAKFTEVNVELNAKIGDAPSDNQQYVRKNATWTVINSFPVGSIQMYAGSTAPTGWLICDGSAVSRTTYADLFDVIGTTYGSGDGSTTFNLPNFAGHMPVGVSTTDSDFDLGDTGGAKGAWQHSHGASQDAHSHTVADYKPRVQNGGASGSKYYTGQEVWTETTSASQPNVYVSANGSDNNTLNVDKANMPPYQTVNFLIHY